MKKFIIILILIIPGISHAAVYGGTNLGYSRYPEFNEREPSPPFLFQQLAHPFFLGTQ